MWIVARRLGLCLSCCAVALFCTSVAALAEPNAAAGRTAAPGAPSAGGGNESRLAGPLADPAVESLVGSGETAAARAAELASPEAVAARVASRTQFDGLGRAAAVALAEKTFGIQHPSWTAPDSAGEGHITKYLSENTASEVAPSGQHLVLASTVPLRSAVGSGQLAPTSLTLQEHDGAFVPANPVVPVSISKTAAGGVSLPFGVSVAPAQAAAPEEPVTVGNRIVYPGTAPDTDFMVEPVPAGVETSWQLLTEASPQENDLQFTLPAGASLQMSKSVAGAAEIVKEGQTLESIRPATAIDADGTPLAVSYSVAGDTLVTHVNLEGSVAFPVMVDPELTLAEGAYGNFGAGTWHGWYSSDNCGSGCYGFFARSSQLQAEIANAPWPGGYSGEWFIWAPGAGETGGSGIARVDLDGVAHESAQSRMWAEIGDSDGTGGYTFNGGEGIQGLLPYSTTSPLSGRDMAFCAGNGGGSDEEDPSHLCNLTDSGEYFSFGNEVLGATSVYNYTEISGAVIHYLDTTAPSEVRLNGPVAEGHWINGSPASSGNIFAHDQGVGIASFDIEIPPGSVNKLEQPVWAEQVACGTFVSAAVCPQQTSSGSIGWPALETGTYKVGVYAIDAAEHIAEEQPDPTLYLDRTPPKLTLTGSLKEHSGGEIGEGDYTLSMAAQDGSSSAPQSGVHKIEVYVDGRRTNEFASTCSDPVGIPKSECFSLSETLTLEGQHLGVGVHTVEVAALDWAGNRTTSTVQVTVNAAANEPLGPGAVNLRTGNYRLEASDVDIAAAGGQLSVGRVYDSRELALGGPGTGGEGGPLGPQWSVSLPDSQADGVWKALEVMPGGSVAMTLASGANVTFQKSGSGYTSPAGFQTFTLSEKSSSPLEYEITDAAGDITVFTGVSSSEEDPTMLYPSTVSKAVGAGGLDKMTDIYSKTAEGIVEPKEEIAPYPASISCVAELVQGCRALEFVYDTATTAEGEAESQWKEFKGRLKEIRLVAWNGKEMQKVPVADYVYDAKGRLRAEWNPETPKPLMTVYGYDSEGHVTAVTGPGQETWAITYGTPSAGDVNAGRVLKVTQAPPSTAPWKGEAPASTKAPVLSGSADVGVRMAVSEGKWSGSPVTYSYLWEDCNSSGVGCQPIAGATNANYTPVAGDVGHTLVAAVSAINGGGSVAASAVPVLS